MNDDALPVPAIDRIVRPAGRQTTWPAVAEAAWCRAFAGTDGES